MPTPRLSDIMKGGRGFAFFTRRERVNTNHKDKKPTHAIYWEALGKFHPDDVCHRTEALYDGNRRGYVLTILNGFVYDSS